MGLQEAGGGGGLGRRIFFSFSFFSHFARTSIFTQRTKEINSACSACLMPQNVVLSVCLFVSLFLSVFLSLPVREMTQTRTQITTVQLSWSAKSGLFNRVRSSDISACAGDPVVAATVGSTPSRGRVKDRFQFCRVNIHCILCTRSTTYTAFYVLDLPHTLYHMYLIHHIHCILGT